MRALSERLRFRLNQFGDWFVMSKVGGPLMRRYRLLSDPLVHRVYRWRHPDFAAEQDAEAVRRSWRDQGGSS